MPGLGSRQAVITPGRKTHIIYDCDDLVILDAEFGLTRQAADIAQLSRQMDGCIFVPGVGIRLAEKTTAIRVDFSGSSSDDGLLTSANATIASGFITRNVNRQRTELPNAFTDSTFPLVAGSWWDKRVPAGVDWDSAAYRLTADQAAFPGPTIEGNDAAMDRVLVGSAPHASHQDVTFNIVVKGQSGQKGLALGVCYFSGPAGGTSDFAGYGQYAAVPFSSGEIRLYERGVAAGASTSTWKQRTTMSFPLTEAWSANMNYFLVVRLFPDTTGQSPGRITFRLAEWAAEHGGSNDVATAIGTAANIALAAVTSRTLNSYLVPSVPGVIPPTVEAPIRLDLPRPFKTMFRIKVLPLRTSGTVKGFPFSLSQGGFLFGEPLRLEWYFDQPTGTNATLDLYAEDDPTYTTVLTPDRQGTIGTAGQTGYYAEWDFPPEATKVWNVNFTLTGAGRTPTLKSLRVRKSGTFEEYVGTNVEGGQLKPASLNIACGSSDADQNRASWEKADNRRELDLLQWSSSIPVRIESEYDPEDDTKRFVRFRGFIEDATGKRLPKRANAGLSQAGAATPFPIRFSYQIRAIGNTLRLKEARSTTLFSFMEDPDAGMPSVPYKATEAIKALMRRGGVGDGRMNIADNAIRLHPVYNGGSDYYQVKPLSDLYEAIQHIARDYLGAALVEDENGGDFGEWTLIYPPEGPYENVAYFTTAKQPAGRIFGLNAYDDTEIEEGDIDGFDHTAEVVPTFPVTDFTVQAKRPICNDLTVSGLGFLQASPVHHLTQQGLNKDSFKHHPDSTAAPGEDNPDWLGRRVALWYINPMLQSDAAVAFVFARLFSILCKGYKLFSVHGPLGIIDHEEEGKKRKLRFGDPVIFYDGEREWQCIVVDCVEDGKNDSAQMATYQLRQVRIGANGPISNALGSFRKAIKEASKRAFNAPIDLPNVARVQVMLNDDQVAEILKLPARQLASPIDLDPASPTYGRSKFVLGVSKLGGGHLLGGF